MTSRPYRVLHIVPGIPFGGLPKVAVDLAAEQVRQGLDVRLVSLYEGQPLISYGASQQIEVLPTHGQSFTMAGCWQYLRYIRSWRPDICHLHLGYLWSNALGNLVKRQPWLYHAHCSWDPPKTLKSWLVGRATLALCDAYVGVSEFVSVSLRRHLPPGSKIYTVHNGMRLPDRPHRARVRFDGTTRYGMATRFAADKGVLEFLAVAAEIAKLDASAHFILAGEGPLMAAARQEAQRLGIGDRCELPGFVRDMDAFWCSLDVAVFTAPHEAFGLRLIEPMALGVPVAAYRTGAGSDEVVEGGSTALMAQWNEPVELARACVSLARDRALAARLTDAARKAVETRFSIDAMARGIGEVYGRLLPEFQPIRSSGANHQSFLRRP
ncbi:glycosyltransferase family 4 protein [Methylococcus capsulatus]|uniref:glycosyltransferase family 4 protein n=1 Tax=Methylococcus capsulatus TaxID=414 RepID=UPI002FDB19CA